MCLCFVKEEGVEQCAPTAFNLCISVTFWLNLPPWLQTTLVFDLQLHRWRTICSPTSYPRLETGPCHAVIQSPIKLPYLPGETPSVLMSGYLRSNTVCSKSQVADKACGELRRRDWNQNSDNGQRASGFDRHTQTRTVDQRLDKSKLITSIQKRRGYYRTCLPESPQLQLQPSGSVSKWRSDVWGSRSTASCHWVSLLHQ